MFRRVAVLLVFAALLVCTATAGAVLVQNGNVTLNGNMSLWAGNATVLSYQSIMNPVERDNFYFLHNTTHYLVGARIYDSDNASDEVLSFYFYNGNKTILVQVKEGNSTAEIYNVTSTLTNIGTIHVISTKSEMGKVKNPYVNVEFALPMTYLDNATNLRVMIKRTSKLMRGMLYGCWHFADMVHFKNYAPSMGRFPWSNRHEWGWMHRGRVKMMKKHNFAEVVGVYPPGAIETDPTTWANLTFVDSFGTNVLHLTIPNIMSNTVIEIYNGTSTAAPLLATIPAKTSMYVDVPSNVTVVVNVSGIPVLTKTYSINLSLSDVLSPNIKVVNTGFAKTAIAVQENANFTAYYDTKLNRTVIDITGSGVSKAYAESSTGMLILSAETIEYNPITNRAKFSVVGNDTVYIMYPKRVRILAANKLENCTIKKDRMILKVGKGLVVIANPKTPFAIADNGMAKKRGVGYIDNDRGNITLINASGGTLDVFYKNPCNMTVNVSSNKVIVKLNTPYSFHGLVNVSIAGTVVTSKKVLFKAPHTVVTVGLNSTNTSSLMAASSAVVTVRDLDSQQTIGTQGVSYSAISPPPKPLLIAIVLVAVVGVVVVLIVAAKKSKQTIRDRVEDSFRFFKKL